LPVVTILESDPSGMTVSMLKNPFARVPKAIRPFVTPGSAADAGASATLIDAMAATTATIQILRGMGLSLTGAAGDTWVGPRSYTQ
jgi:hypothetical protein